MPKNRNQSVVSAGSPSVAGIAAAQSLAAAGALTLAAGAANILNSSAYAQPVLISSAGNDSGITFTINGLDYGGSPISETVTGSNATSVSTLRLFASVTSITSSGATASTVTAGTDTTQYGPWLIAGAQRNNYEMTVRAFIGTTQTPSTATYGIQATSDINIMNQSGGYADDIITLETGLTQNLTSYPNATYMAYRAFVSAGGPVHLRLQESRTA